jgi:hypothetical protein
VIPEKIDEPPGDRRLTGAEVTGAALVSFMAFALAMAYLSDWIGLIIAPAAILVASGGAALGLLIWLHQQAIWRHGEVAAFIAVVAVALGWLLWLAWPSLLLPGGGADLTHHLQLVDYLDRNWQLVHDPPVEAYLGEMVHYTPGAHLLSSLVGRWAGTDGFHAVYPVVAWSVALKTGFVFLIALRILGAEVRLQPDTPWAFALIAVVLLLLPRAFFTGSFARYSYVAQVVSELFAVVMWWALVVWDERPSIPAIVVFAIAGIGVFLTWPVWIGPPLIVLAAILYLRSGISLGDRWRAFALATAPIALVAVIHALGRLEWAKIVRTDAAMPLPAWQDFTWSFLVLAAAGMIASSTARRGRATALLIAACGVQAAALFVVAKANGAVVPYMAVKMAYLGIYPLAVGAALALSLVWRAAIRAAHLGRASRVLAWGLALVVLGVIGRRALGAPLPAPTVTEPLYRAGQWARANLDPSCVDYIVPGDNTAYWLHLAVLGNRRMSPRTASDSTFIARDAIVRWINPGGLPFAVADLAILPKDVLANTDELARFGSAVVIKRRGVTSCPDSRIKN